VRIDRVELSKMLRSGVSQVECARHFSVSEAAISKAKSELRIATIKNVALESAHKVVANTVDVMEQLNRVNREAQQIIDKFRDSPKVCDQELVIRAMSEIRRQVETCLEISKTLYDVQEMERFQQEVLEAIGECDVQVREKIVQRLKERRTLRSAVRFVG
jgi:hypothetical protein